jgi:hypothetical protein
VAAKQQAKCQLAAQGYNNARTRDVFLKKLSKKKFCEL